MSELWIYNTYTPREGRGLASSTGFEAEDARLAERRAEAAYEGLLTRLRLAAEEWATECWRQSRNARPQTEEEFVSNFVGDVMGCARDVSKERE